MATSEISRGSKSRCCRVGDPCDVVSYVARHDRSEVRQVLLPHVPFQFESVHAGLVNLSRSLTLYTPDGLQLVARRSEPSQKAVVALHFAEYTLGGDTIVGDVSNFVFVDVPLAIALVGFLA